MDKININKLEVFAYHGVLKEEKTLGQKFLVSATLHLSLNEASLTDNIKKTVNYASVCKDITRLLTKESYNLIETCAEKIAMHLLHDYPLIKKVDITIEKPGAPIKQSFNRLSVNISRQWNNIYLALGTNIGNLKDNLNNAISELSNDKLVVIKKSSYHLTKPISPIPQDDYLNAVIKCKTTYSPNELITHALSVEKTLGRVRNIHQGPRTIDIDILIYEGVLSSDPKLVLPHPHMCERLFVLTPFCEVDPYFVHPLLGKTIQQLKISLE